jgi:hypothetical protein
MGAETAIAPPMIAEDDGVLNTKNIKLGPRKIIVANSVDSMKALTTGADINAGLLTSERLQGSIRKILLADQLPPADGPAKTAYEWSVRVQALRAMLGPMFGRFQAEFLQPLIERAFGIAWRANIASGYRLVGKPPASLLNRSFTVRYLSPLARAQKLGSVDAMDRYEASLGLAMQTSGDMSLGDVYDWEEAERERGLLLGVPQKLVRDQRSTQAVRDAKNEAAQKEQQAMAQQQGQMELQGAMAQRDRAAAARCAVLRDLRRRQARRADLRRSVQALCCERQGAHHGRHRRCTQDLPGRSEPRGGRVHRAHGEPAPRH